MAWPALQYSKTQVDKAGDVLVSSPPLSRETDAALEVLNNWRAAHSFALNTMQMGLRQRIRKVCPAPLIAQRIKRTPSIIHKLRRFKGMRLSRIQDIGGCRGVLGSVTEVRLLEEAYKRSRQKHAIANKKDYISEPKDSGYRGIHLIYQYRSDRAPEHNGRLIEIQLRSRLQHAWATAVETVGVFLDQALKSSEGSADWLRFFALAGSAFAQREQLPLVPRTPDSGAELRDSIDALWADLKVARRLSDYGQALQVHDDFPRGSYYFVLHLQPSTASESSQLKVIGFPKDLLDAATEKYLEVEKTLVSQSGSQAVLVASESMVALKRAYPNYFLDTQVFIRELAGFLGRKLSKAGKRRSDPMLPFELPPRQRT